jgi:hypothetical protein
MSSPFLVGGDFNLSVLQDGSTPIFVSTAKVGDLATGPIHADATHQLYGGLIQLADCNFTPIETPYAGTLEAKDFTTAYDTVPVSLNTFIQDTNDDIAALQTLRS